MENEHQQAESGKLAEAEIFTLEHTGHCQDEKCGNCRFYFRQRRLSECHYMTPFFVTGEFDRSWPKVAATDRRGHYEFGETPLNRKPELW